MAIARNLAHLPPASDGEAAPPDPRIRYGQYAIPGPDEHQRTDRTSRLGHSDAGGCARALSYKALNVEPSNPMDAAGRHVTGIGTLLHELWQDRVMEVYPDARSEVTVTHEDHPGIEGHVDLVHDETAIELKTMGGFSFKMARGERGPAEGPKADHVTQLALHVRGLGAQEGVLVYVATEAISVQAAKKQHLGEYERVVAEWSFPAEYLNPIADEELSRLSAIVAMADEGVLAKRMIPGVPGEIIDPMTGRWERVSPSGVVLDVGSHWKCPGYCSFRDRCAADGPGRVEVAS